MTTKPSTAAREAEKLLAGRRSRALLAKLFGLAHPNLPVRVAAMAWVQDHLEVALFDDKGARTVLYVRPRDAEVEAPGFIEGRRLAIWYRGAAPSDAAERVLRRTAPAWGGIEISRLLEILHADPERQRLDAPSLIDAADQPQDQSHEKGREKLAIGTWTLDQTYADFLAIDVLELMPYESIEASNPLVRISHSDLECHCFMPREKASNMNLVDFPWLRRTEEEGDGWKNVELETTLSTDLTERAIILGCDSQLRDVLDRATTLEPAKPIVFTNTCLPATIGEDVVSVIKKVRKTSPVPILLHDRSAVDFDHDLFKELLVDRRLEAQKKGAEVDPTAINLMGFERDDDLAEIRAWLEALGLRVNVALLPIVAPSDIDQLPVAALNVFHRCSTHWERFFNQLELDNPTPSLHVDGPWGPTRTLTWFREIAEKMGIDEGNVTELVTSSDEHRACVELSQRANRHTVGVVVPERDLVCLEDPGYTAGIPLVGVIEDLGFRLHLLVDAPREGRRAAFERLAKLVRDESVHRFDAFEGLDALRKALADSPADAIVSNYAFDWRLTEAGKGRVSVLHFDKGMAGAVRTQKRILAACRSTFLKTYRPYLRRSGLGLRPSEKAPSSRRDGC